MYVKAYSLINSFSLANVINEFKKQKNETN